MPNTKTKTSPNSTNCSRGNTGLKGVLAGNVPAWIPKLSNQKYHDGPGWSSSQIKEIGRSPKSFYSKYLSDRAPSDPTPSMVLGRLVHTLVLEPDEFVKEYAILPEVNARTKAGKEELAVWRQQNVGQQEITRELHSKALKMRDAVFKTDASAALLTQADLEFEGSGFWNCEWSGELCKYRPDARSDLALLDLKTISGTPDYDTVIRTVLRFNYHTSAAHYLEGDRIVRDTDHGNFVLVFVSSDEPFEVGVYTLDSEFLELGRRMNRRWLRELRHCFAEDRWPGVNAGQITELEIPPYLSRRLG